MIVRNLENRIQQTKTENIQKRQAEFNKIFPKNKFNNVTHKVNTTTSNRDPYYNIIGKGQQLSPETRKLLVQRIINHMTTKNANANHPELRRTISSIVQPKTIEDIKSYVMEYMKIQGIKSMTNNTQQRVLNHLNKAPQIKTILDNNPMARFEISAFLSNFKPETEV